jgi:hypothetical protein
MARGRYAPAIVSAVVLAVSHAAFGAQATPVDAVLAQVAGYVGDFIPRFSDVVAVETYEQRTTAQFATPLAPSEGMKADGFGSRSVVWRLTSDFMLVRYQVAELNWIAFRDPGVVNGIVLDRPKDRLVRLFTESTLDATERAAAITMESTRFQVPGGSFAVTNPLLVVALMQAHYQPRLRFTLGSEERLDGLRVRRLRFEERDEQPAEPGNGNRARQKWPPLLGDVGRVRGTVWLELEPETGRIVKTEARLGAASSIATTVTTFAQDAGLGLTVPVEMQTSWMYKDRPVNGVAKYGEFRRFAVRTETQVQPPAEP